MPLLLGLVVAAAADAGSPLITDWAVSPTYTFNGHVACDQPDAGISITVFREPEWFELGDACGFSPLRCSTSAARDQVLQQVDAGVLRFAEPIAKVRPDTDGWFKVPVHEGDALLAECGGLVEVFAAMPLESPPIDLVVDPRESELPDDIVSVVVINPFTREVRNVTREEFIRLPPRVTAGAWAAANRPSNRWSAPVFPLGFGEDFPLPSEEKPSLGKVSEWGFDGGTPVTVIVEAPGMTPSNLGIAVRPPQSNRAVAGTYTRANGARFGLVPGDWHISVRMAGAIPAGADVVIDDAPRTVFVRLERGYTGVVVDEAGKPVERACLTYDDTGACRAWSDRDGQFALDFTSELSWLRATHPYIGSTDAVPIKLGVPLKLTLRARNKVVVRVPAINGRPARGVLVVEPVAAPTHWFLLPRRSLYPRFEGDITLAALEPGSYQLFISAPGQQTQELKLKVPRQGKTTVRLPPWKPSVPE